MAYPEKLFQQNLLNLLKMKNIQKNPRKIAVVLLKNLALVTILPKNHNLVIAIVQNVLLAH